MAKTKDLFLNMVANPDMTLEDLASVGLTSENTMLLDRAQYASNEKVQDMFKDSEGNFDEQKFNTWYDLAEQSYNILANDEANLSLMNVTAYDSDNIFVDPSKRKVKNEPIAVKLPNPDRLNSSIHRIGKIGPRTLSQDEIAQTQQVLLNPTEVANGAEPVYGSSPNDSWFEDFWDTRVMAAWDEDGTHIDPVTGKETQHKKGDLKLNENGTYYYESLDGRSVYGKRILNKFNTLTTDGSAWNKYDFFDSDSIEQKSIGGSITKNLALVGSMFIPYVGWGVAAASVAHQSAGLFATLGKMLAGSDNPTLDAVEGWVKSVDRRNLKTEYAQQNTWCWENFIDLIGDTTAQLREQRAIFKFAPGIIKGDFKALSEKAMKEYGEELAKKELANATSLSFKDLYKLAAKKGGGDPRPFWEPMMAGAKNTFSLKAEKAVKKYLDDYYKLGEPIAKAYMTAITVQDTFGEAIQAGATDGEATMLTLGYAAAEAALLSTDLGKWIMPELRTSRLRNKMIAKKLFELPQETREMSRQLSKLKGETKKDWAKRLFNVGRDIARAEYSMMPTTIGTIAAQGLGEGVEEVSEEALADFSKSCFNLVQQLQGDDVRMHAWNHGWDWTEAVNRYGMSFVGGIFGGGINAAASDYKANREILNMDSQQAMQQLIYMARNNELDDFWKTVNKTTIAPKELSTQLNDSGIGYKPGTKEDNQDLAAKKALKKQIDMINSILNAENAKLDDDGLLTALLKADPTLQDLDPVKEYRMHALSNSATAGRFLNEWNTIDSDIVKNRLEQQKIMSKYGDGSSEKMSKEDEEALKDWGKKLKVLQQRKDAMLDGTRTREYVRDALFEMTHPVKEVFDDWATLIRYSEAMTGKKFSDISEERKAELKDQYEKVKGSNQYAEKVHMLADIYETMATTASQGIQASAEFYEKIKQDSYQRVADLDKIMRIRLDRLINNTKDENSGIVKIQGTLDKNYKDSFIELYADDDVFMQGFSQIETDINDRIAAIYNGRTDQDLTDAEKVQIEKLKEEGDKKTNNHFFDYLTQPSIQLMDEFIQLGFIHPETKLAVNNTMISLKDRYNALLSSADQRYDLFGDPDDYDLTVKYQGIIDNIDEKLQQINTLSNTPIIENLKQFQLSTDTDKTVLDLIQYLHDKENLEKQDISVFTLDTATKQQFKDARKLLEMYRSAISGARFDNVDIDNIVGFNTTLNELSGANEGVKLAEIDGQTADLVLEDVNTLLQRLDYAEGLHNLNNGNKYNMQAKTALNKNYILFNKIKSFISILEDDDEWKDQNGQTSLQQLLEARNKASKLTQYSGFEKPFESRIFAITPDEKDEVESELIDLQVALHNFFKDRIGNDQASVDKLAKLFTYDRFKGLLRENNDFLNQDSVDIDDSAFIWWMCATAALDPTQFNVNYNAIVGQEKDGERPIAPIPTQELGVFALTAAITNGDMFRTFGRALRKSLSEHWEGLTDDQRDVINKESNAGFLKENRRNFFKNNDFLPNFENILFVEGIAGSGKSTGVLKTLSRVLANSNPDFAQKKFVFAHTDRDKATTLAESTEFKNFEVHDHDSLLKYMSSDYNPPTVENGIAVYEMDTDVILSDGYLRAPWKVNSYNNDEVPKVFFIDEWSHYNQLEQDLIQRFAQQYGSTVITMGDYDQLTPKAKIKFSDGSEFEITPNRNMAPRIAKLGVSMRTDNDVKTGNVYRMLAWRKNPTDKVQLHYYEDDNGIYGDKAYTANTTYDKATLDKIKLDIQKMVSTLKDGEKIGYIYHSEDSELYKWIDTNAEIKNHIIPYQEKDAHGREAQYYIVENNREANQDALDYFESAYTGITRSEQGSLIITGTSTIRRTVNEQGQPLVTNKFNTKGLQFESVKDTEMLPDTYTDDGTRNFTRQRKRSLDKKYQGMSVTPFDVKERTRQVVPLNIPVPGQTTGGNTGQGNQNNPTQNQPNNPPAPNNPPSGASTSGNTQQSSQQQQQQNQPTQQQQQQTQQQPTQGSQSSTGEGLPPLPPEGATIQTPPAQGPGAQVQHPEPSLEEFGGTRVPDDPNFDPTELFAQGDENWQWDLPKGQKLYREDGILEAIIVGAHDNYYTLYHPESGETSDMIAGEVDQYFTSKPETNPKFAKGFKFKDIEDNQVYTISNVYLDYSLNYSLGEPKVVWNYEVEEDQEIFWEEDDLVQDLLSGDCVAVDVQTEELPENDFENEGAREWEDAANEVMDNSEELVEVVKVVNGDLDFNPLGFTFNNQYFADKFDDNDAIVVTQYDAKRIDNGYGLHKINPRAFKYKKDIKNAIGEIRRHLEFSSNADIIKTVQRLTGERGLTIEWGFISKAPGNQGGTNARYAMPQATPEYLVSGEQDNYLMPKQIAAIIYKNGKPILELPAIDLQAPHSIFAAMCKKGICSDITSKWTQQEGQTYNDLITIIEYLKNTYRNRPGYQHLRKYLELYTFDSNGFQRITNSQGSTWNLHKYCANKGNFYITKRISDNGEFDFVGKWVELEKTERADRFISPILMNNEDYYYDSVNDKTIPIFRKYTPYVFISDDPSINTVQDAAEQYLKQQANPREEKRVKAVPVIPPEGTVTQYIQAMRKVISKESTAERIGNRYSAYRIWNYILDPTKNSEPFTYENSTYPSRAAFVMSQLRDDMRQDVLKYVNILNQIAQQNPIQSGESKLDYKVRLASLQNSVLKSETNDVAGAPRVYERLRAALVACCNFQPVGDTDTVKNAILDTIQQLCDEGKCTGILYKPGFDKDQEGVSIGGFAYRVKTDGPYNFPGAGSYRIFGKNDPPTYQISSLFDNIDRWVSNITPVNSNQRRFKGKDAWTFYLQEYDPQANVTPKLNLTNVRQYYNNLLVRLGMNQYNMDESVLENCASEAEALEKVDAIISNAFVSQNPGTFFIKDVRTGKYRYSRLSEYLPEYADYRFQRGAYSNDGTYLISMFNGTTGNEQTIEIELTDNNSFQIRPKQEPQTNSQSSSLNLSELKQQVLEKFNSSKLLSGNQTIRDLIDNMLLQIDEINNTINLPAIEQLLATSNLSKMQLRTIENWFNLEQIRTQQITEQTLDTSDDQNQDPCINPITISFI